MPPSCAPVVYGREAIVPRSFMAGIATVRRHVQCRERRPHERA